MLENILEEVRIITLNDKRLYKSLCIVGYRAKLFVIYIVKNTQNDTNESRTSAERKQKED